MGENMIYGVALIDAAFAFAVGSAWGYLDLFPWKQTYLYAIASALIADIVVGVIVAGIRLVMS